MILVFSIFIFSSFLFDFFLWKVAGHYRAPMFSDQEQICLTCYTNSVTSFCHMFMSVLKSLYLLLFLSLPCFSFLDKMYCFSSPEAMEKFMRNPRPYLLPPQPRPPCKIVVLGPPVSGKSSVCALLAQKYNAKVSTCCWIWPLWNTVIQCFSWLCYVINYAVSQGFRLPGPLVLYSQIWKTNLTYRNCS